MQEGGSFGNMLVIGQGIQNHPKVFSGVLRYEFSYHIGEASIN